MIRNWPSLPQGTVLFYTEKATQAWHREGRQTHNKTENCHNQPKRTSTGTSHRLKLHSAMACWHVGSRQFPCVREDKPMIIREPSLPTYSDSSRSSTKPCVYMAAGTQCVAATWVCGEAALPSCSCTHVWPAPVTTSN